MWAFTIVLYKHFLEEVSPHLDMEIPSYTTHVQSRELDYWKHVFKN